jgi:molybdenum cofactor cytidylyltransferase
MNRSCSAIIPAAGNSGRMGADKTMLSNGGGQTFAGYLINGFGLYGCRPVVLVVNENFNSSIFQLNNLITVVNHDLDKGRSWSIRLGLQQIPEGHDCFIQNIDNPFLAAGLLDRLAEAVPDNGYAVPVYKGRGGHPILLGKEVVGFLRKQQDLFDFRKMLQHFIRLEVDCRDKGVLWNINTPDDYQSFLKQGRFSQKKM